MENGKAITTLKAGKFLSHKHFSNHQYFLKMKINLIQFKHTHIRQKVQKESEGVLNYFISLTR